MMFCFCRGRDKRRGSGQPNVSAWFYLSRLKQRWAQRKLVQMFDLLPELNVNGNPDMRLQDFLSLVSSYNAYFCFWLLPVRGHYRRSSVAHPVQKSYLMPHHIFTPDALPDSTISVLPEDPRTRGQVEVGSSRHPTPPPEPQPPHYDAYLVGMKVLELNVLWQAKLNRKHCPPVA